VRDEKRVEQDLRDQAHDPGGQESFSRFIEMAVTWRIQIALHQNRPADRIRNGAAEGAKLGSKSAVMSGSANRNVTVPTMTARPAEAETPAIATWRAAGGW